MSQCHTHYGLISGILLKDFEKGAHPHLYLYIKNDTEEPFRVAVNVRDYDDSDVFFAHIKDLKADFLKNLSTLKNGAYYLQPANQENSLDYIKEEFIKEAHFTQTPEEELGNTLLDILKPYIDADNGSRVTAYGSRFPGGIHDIHMNQGYPHSSLPSCQDGALILYDAINDKYEGLFFHFHSQTLTAP
ncbi:alternate gene name: yukI [Bathymodiolus thermophilus thioautotrophic gill symbiont]|uniref:DUF2278 domain-containing protein n=1 Tax=Bathymodiolus thermophilus thioautotrophic gill symbiont TaxID=2360 RepID=A0A1J5U8B6_9GAMM|nr:DUF2278 family protein [Bathymodiolus thermophilus thioautotrophic gill symbiont]OIR24625.1 hypothetical protein BGC33_11165 [Bathymodiolus thermophilus thioautotrophic gill symbiont]SGZ60512.1 alternate gene name: yukI [Bathymodiolus thermophilus thioautotrophic gill symbiont]